jgi:hypothetical protein
VPGPAIEKPRPGKAEVPEPDDPVVVDGSAEDGSGLVSVINGPPYGRKHSMTRNTNTKRFPI